MYYLINFKLHLNLSLFIKDQEMTTLFCCIYHFYVNQVI